MIFLILVSLQQSEAKPHNTTSVHRKAGEGTVKSSMKETKDILPQRSQRNADLEIKAE